MDLEKLKSVLDDIGIEEEGRLKEYENKPDRYIIELEDSDEYAKCYTLLDKYRDADMKDEGSMASEFATVLTYNLPGYKFMLNANFTDDYYAIVIKEEDNE